jgi:hypothetical protein
MVLWIGRNYRPEILMGLVHLTLVTSRSLSGRVPGLCYGTAVRIVCMSASQRFFSTPVPHAVRCRYEAFSGRMQFSRFFAGHVFS